MLRSRLSPHILRKSTAIPPSRLCGASEVSRQRKNISERVELRIASRGIQNEKGLGYVTLRYVYLVSLHFIQHSMDSGYEKVQISHR